MGRLQLALMNLLFYHRFRFLGGCWFSVSIVSYLKANSSAIAWFVSVFEI